jgi:hypothetical protein
MILGPNMDKSHKVKFQFGTQTMGKSTRNKILFWAPETQKAPVGLQNVKIRGIKFQIGPKDGLNSHRQINIWDLTDG